GHKLRGLNSGTPFTVEKSPLDFADEVLPPPNTEGVGTEEQIQDEVSHGVLMYKGLKIKQKRRLSTKIRRRLRVFRDQDEVVNISLARH
ncbi:hypothetical protein Tco_0662282, partial [Tanacetum coccineum]